jgi:hypothetical protein
MELVKQIELLIDQILNSLGSLTEDEIQQFSLVKDQKSGLSKTTGFYLLINQKTKRYYFGTTLDLSQRKGEYMLAFRQAENGDISKKISQLINKDLLLLDEKENRKHTNKDFLFFPFFQIKRKNYEIEMSWSQGGKNQVSNYLETIEKYILEKKLNKSENIYNVKPSSKWEQFNTFGGTPNSGQSKKPVVLNAIAYESVSVAAKKLEVDRKTIRNYIKTNKASYLTPEQWEGWEPNKKVSKE